MLDRRNRPSLIWIRQFTIKRAGEMHASSAERLYLNKLKWFETK
jgi:hypothetical protein